MNKKNEINEILKEELGSSKTKEELKKLEIENVEDVITADDLEVYRQKFPEMDLDKLDEILSLTIKEDRVSKIITFLCMLSAYTEDSQFNVSFNAPASTGKSYIVEEIHKLFPSEDVIDIGYATPTSFFHDKGDFDEEKGVITIDLSRKILIFIDQPHPEVLQKLRPLLSHDQKVLLHKITDRNKKGQNRTKNVMIIGFPAVIFCTAGLKMDEQEVSRVVLLSPEITQEKIRSSIELIMDRQADRYFEEKIEGNYERQLLKERIQIIKRLNFNKVCIPDMSKIMECFSMKSLAPTDMRNISKLYSIIKGLTLLNFAHREIKGKDLFANEKDVEEGLNLWKEIRKYQELGIPPFVYWFYEKVIVPAYREKNEPLKKKDIIGYYKRVFSGRITDKRLRVEILPQLVNCGLLIEEKDPDDKREKVYSPNEEFDEKKEKNVNT